MIRVIAQKAGASPKRPLRERADLNSEIIERIGRPFAVRDDHEFGPLVRPSDILEPIQRWFRYREGYTVELCRRLFDENEHFIIDPFCGFGSTLVAAQDTDIPSLGLDVNPLAVFVSRVKTRTYRRATLNAVRAHVSKVRSLTVNAAPCKPPSLKILPKLFHSEILRALLIFKASILKLETAAAREFLYLAWISILERVSNVYREGNGIKYRNRIRHGNVYTIMPYDQWQAKRFPADKFGYVRAELLKQIELMLGEVETYTGRSQPSVVHGDASLASKFSPKRGASLVLFSPPYCNCFNYIKAYKLELWMAGFIENYRGIRELTSMGLRSRTESLVGRVTDPYPGAVDSLIRLMNRSKLWSDAIPDVVRGYFADMKRTLSSLHAATASHGRCVMVVGNSAYGDVLIPTDILLSTLASSVGFEVEEIVVARHLTTSSQQKEQLKPLRAHLRESIVFMRKPR